MQKAGEAERGTKQPLFCLLLQLRAQTTEEVGVGGRRREAAVGGPAPPRHIQLVFDEKLLSSQYLKTRKRN